MAVCGKGGSGKSVMVRLLAGGMRRRRQRVLVVDSDESNTGLHRMLGFDNPPQPLIEFMGGKNKVEEDIAARIKSGVPEHLVQLMTREISVSDIPTRYIVEKDGTSLVVVGKILMALEGCACPMGIVSRSFLKELRLEADEIAVIDMEAGVEHFGRGVETSVDCVLVVVEPVLNKITSEQLATELTDELNRRDLTVIGTIRHDPDIFESCLRGRPLSGRAAEEDVERILDFMFP